ncbi:cell surface glycoprotein CD200 receptor 1-like isoform X2 [Scleropages formosus]|nr:cell surface glycoprotein CD200 receptor 1-like isoform X2 [Scleropages formosus]
MFFTWTAPCVFLLRLCILTQGQPFVTSLSEGKQMIRSPLIDYRNEVLDAGSSVDMACYNITQSKLIYTLWKLHMRGHTCDLRTDYLTENYENNCQDGKVLRSGTGRESHLHIPQFTLTDEGIYLCETAYWGGTYTAEITVSARVRPQISSWLEVEHGRRVAVCSAVGGKPVASISWSTMGNFRGNQSSILNPDSTFTVDSRLALPENVSSDNLNCIVTHPCLGEAHIEKVSPSALKEGLAPVIAAQYSVLSIGTVILLCGILTSCCIIKKSVGKWSQRTRFFYIPQISRTQQSHLSSY